MTTHPLKLSNPRVRALARSYLDRMPDGGMVHFEPEPKRSKDANAKMWAMLGDISKQVQHNGTSHTPETWKHLAMHALGHEVRFEIGLNNEPFPVGFRSSRLTVAQMADLITWLYQYGDEQGVKWSERGWDYGESK